MVQVTIKSFTDLNVWKESHKLVLMTYKITGNFPSKETYSLTDQMRRAAASITANILELENFILIAKDVGYLDKPDFNHLAEQANISHKLLQGFIQKTKTFINRKS